MAVYGGEWVVFSFRTEKNKKCSSKCFMSPRGTFPRARLLLRNQNNKKGAHMCQGSKKWLNIEMKVVGALTILKMDLSRRFISGQVHKVFQESEAAILNPR